MENFELSEKTFNFARRAVKLHKYLVEKFPGNELSALLLRDAVNLGRTAEVAAGESKGKPFLDQLRQANTYLLAAMFYVRLLRETEYLDNQQSESLLQDCREIQQMLKGILGSVQTASN